MDNDTSDKMLRAAEKCIAALEAVEDAGAAIAEVSPTARLRIELDEPCPQCHDLGTVPEEDDTKLNVRRPCPTCNPKSPEWSRRIPVLDPTADPGTRIHSRFPIYVQHVLADQIKKAQHFDELSIANLDRWTDRELAIFADCYAPAVDQSMRKRDYMLVLAGALRHGKDSPELVRAAVELVHRIADSGREAER